MWLWLLSKSQQSKNMCTTIIFPVSTATHTQIHRHRHTLRTSSAPPSLHVVHKQDMSVFRSQDIFHCQTFEWMLIHKYLIGLLVPPWEETPTPRYLTNKTAGRRMEGRRLSTEKHRERSVCSSERLDSSPRNVTVMFYWRLRGWRAASTEGGGREGWRS